MHQILFFIYQGRAIRNDGSQLPKTNVGHFLYLLRHSSLISYEQVGMLGMKLPAWKKQAQSEETEHDSDTSNVD